MSETDQERGRVPLQMKQQVHDCVVAFEALLWQTLKGHMATPAASSAAPPRALDQRSHETIVIDELPRTESFP